MTEMKNFFQELLIENQVEFRINRIMHQDLILKAQVSIYICRVLYEYPLETVCRSILVL